ncbi:MAG: protein jag [Helicobacter sp.]|nr:protein jag [Helicobacter sp.]MDE5817006.1 protein jag [Helicobacter sp.]MDE7196322.1 protein jag [Helicobacter sp.]
MQDSKPKPQPIEKFAESKFEKYAESKPIESKPKKPFNPLPIAELREYKEAEESHHEGKKRSPSELASIAAQVQKEINELFGLMPFNINPIKVSVFDDHTLFIEFHGEDAALLIGKEGYRYKALSYMLFHWINTRHKLMVRLEIAEFLHNQELMIAHYLAPVIEMIKETGKGQTRPLDGVLAYIALRQLRDTFPDKYVSFRKTSDGGKYVIVNEFYH